MMTGTPVEVPLSKGYVALIDGEDAECATWTRRGGLRECSHRK